MNPGSTAQVTGELFALSRSALDAADGGCGPFIPFESVLDSMRMVRLRRMGLFWDNDSTAEPNLLAERIEDVLAGLHAAGKPWSFVVRGRQNGIECGFGVSDLDCEQAIASALPGSETSCSWKPLQDGWTPVALESLAITGIPTRKSDHLERVCRGLHGSDWIYMVYSHPQIAAHVRSQGIGTELRLSEVKQTYLYKDAAPNASAERLVESLERQAKRFRSARSIGMWDVYSALSVRGDGPRLAAASGLLSGAYAGKKSLPEPLRVRAFTTREPAEPNTWSVLTTSECATLATPPREDRPGFEVVPDIRFGVQASTDDGKQRIEIGEILDRGQPSGNVFSISERDITKHGLIVGVTGAGKTNTCFELLAQVWREGKGVPFMVLESAKSEYRDLLNDPRFTGLRVYTIGNENISPIRINPFAVATGVLVQSHIDFLKALFSAAFVLYPPMPYVLDQALHEVYEDFGWDLVTNTNVRGSDSDLLFPTLDDLIEKTRDVVNGLGYDKRLEMDIQAGLTARLDGLRRGGGKGPMLNTRFSTSDEDLFEKPCILELKALVTDEEKAFFIGLMLIRLHEYYESRPHRHDGGLRHVTLIEEAHRLLRNVSTEQGSEVSANPKGQAVEVFGNMLAEIRAYGEGVLIAEQVPTKLLQDAIKNTNLKIVHRLVAMDDRKLLGDTMNLDEEQSAFVATLGTGEAVVYAEGLRKPVLLRVGLADVKRSGGRVSDRDVADAAGEGPQEFVRFPLRGCASCPARGLKPSCSNHVVSVRTSMAARAVVQSIRFGQKDVTERYHSFRLLCEAESATPQCALNDHAESLVTRLGRLNHWPVDETITLLDASLEIISQATTDKAFDVSQVARSFETTEMTAGPFDGCEACEMPCRFRFDIPRDVEAFSKAYLRAFSGPPESFKERWKNDVVLPVVRAIRASLPTSDDNVSKVGAYCFAVQHLPLVSNDTNEITNALASFKDALA